VKRASIIHFQHMVSDVKRAYARNHNVLNFRCRTADFRSVVNSLLFASSEFVSMNLANFSCL